MVPFTATYTVPYTTTAMVPVSTGGFVGGFSSGGFATGGFGAGGFALPVGGFQAGSVGGFGGVMPVGAGGFTALGAMTGQGGSAGGFQSGGLTDVETQALRALLARALAQDGQSSGRGALTGGFSDTVGGLLAGRDTETRLRQLEADIRKIKVHLAAEVGEREKLTAALRELVDAHDQLAAAAQSTFATKQELKASEEKTRTMIKDLEKKLDATKEELMKEIKKPKDEKKGD
jgi:hypothetical protein